MSSYAINHGQTEKKPESAASQARFVLMVIAVAVFFAWCFNTGNHAENRRMAIEQKKVDAIVAVQNRGYDLNDDGTLADPAQLKQKK